MVPYIVAPHVSFKSFFQIIMEQTWNINLLKGRIQKKRFVSYMQYFRSLSNFRDRTIINKPTLQVFMSTIVIDHILHYVPLFRRHDNRVFHKLTN